MRYNCLLKAGTLVWVKVNVPLAGEWATRAVQLGAARLNAIGRAGLMPGVARTTPPVATLEASLAFARQELMAVSYAIRKTKRQNSALELELSKPARAAS